MSFEEKIARFLKPIQDQLGKIETIQREDHKLIQNLSVRVSKIEDSFETTEVDDEYYISEVTKDIQQIKQKIEDMEKTTEEITFLKNIVKNLKGVKPEHDYSNVCEASSNGDIQGVKYFVEFCGASADEVPGSSTTPLCRACANGNVELVKYLVRKGATIEKTEKSTNCTPLHLASEMGHIDIVKYLVEEKGASINVKDNKGDTPLNRAISNGKIKIAKYLAENKGSNIDERNNDGKTPLHLASAAGCIDIVKYLIEEKGANVKTKDKNGKTPLNLAKDCNHPYKILFDGETQRVIEG